jgi:hypothetical protein
MTRNEHALESFWSLLAAGRIGEIAARGCKWDDPIFDASGAERLVEWFRSRSSGGPAAHLRTIADERRTVVEHVLPMKNGLVWNQSTPRAEKAETYDLAAAVVADGQAPYGAIRVYFGTWSVLDGEPKMRVGPIAPDERARKLAASASSSSRRRAKARPSGSSCRRSCGGPSG